MNPLNGYLRRDQLFLFILLINHATLPVIQALPIDTGDAVSDNEEVTTVTQEVTSAASPTTSPETAAEDQSAPLDEESALPLTPSKREEPLSVKNDSNESSREDEEDASTAPVDSTSQLVKDVVTDQLSSQSESELRKQCETHAGGVVACESKDTTTSTRGDSSESEARGAKGDEKEERSIEKESTDESEREKVPDTKSIIHTMWVKQGGEFAYPSDAFTFKSSSPVHSSILILPLVSPAYQMVKQDAHKAKDVSARKNDGNIFLSQANALPHHVLGPSLSSDSSQPLASPQLSAHQNHALHRGMKDLFTDQLVSSAVQSFDPRVRFTTAHSNSPMIPLLPFDSAASLFAHHPYGPLNAIHQPSNLQYASFTPVNLPTRWWHSYPSSTSSGLSAGHSTHASGHSSSDPSLTPATEMTVSSTVDSKASDDAEEIESTTLPTEEAGESATSTESTVESVNEEERGATGEEASGESGESGEKKESATEESGEKSDGEAVNGGRSDVDVDADGDTSESGGRAKRQAKSEERQVDAVSGSSGGSTIDDVVKSIVAANSKNNAIRGEGEESASAPSTPREDILKNGQGTKALQVGLDIASDILSTIRDALPEATQSASKGKETVTRDLTSSSSRHSERSLSSLLSKSSFGEGRLASDLHTDNQRDSGLFHVFRGVFGDLRL